MAQLTVIKDEPEVPGVGGPVALGAVGALLAAFSLSDPASPGWAALWGLTAAAAVPWFMSSQATAKQIRGEHEAFLERAQAEVRKVNGGAEPQALTVPVNLQKNETCYWPGEAQWYELRKQTKRVKYSGFTGSIPVVKGVRYRIGSIAPTVEREEGLTLIDTGTLYVTNKRLFFDGHGKNVTLTYRSLSGVQVFLGGMNLEKQTGRTPTLLIEDGAERAAALITRQLSGGAGD